MNVLRFRKHETRFGQHAFDQPAVAQPVNHQDMAGSAISLECEKAKYAEGRGTYLGR